jgi:hypothetical protein
MKSFHVSAIPKFYFMKKICVFISMVFVFISCSQKNKNSSEFVRIDFLYNDEAIDVSGCDTIKIPTPLNKNTKFFLDSVCSNYSFTVLETTKESMIGKVDKVVFTDSLIFVGDFEIQKSIFVFDHDGQFIKKIKRQGRGPGEYRYRISNFFIADSLKKIIITDDDRSQIIETDYQGNLIHTESPKLLGGDIFKFPNDSLLYFYVAGRKNVRNNDQSKTNDYENNLLILDENYKISKSYFPINSDYELNYGVFNNFVPHEAKLFFKPIKDNRIFEISNKSLNCRYYVDFADLVVDSFYMAPRNEVRRYVWTKSHIPDISRFMIGDEFLYFWGSYKKKYFQILYSVKSKNTYLGFDPVFKSFAGRIVGMHNQHIIMAMNATQLEYFKPIKKNLGKKEQHIINTVDFYDNPILILGKIRDF